MSARPLAFLALTAFVLLAADDPQADDKARLVGTWTVTAAEQGGQKLPADAIAGQSLVFGKERYFLRQTGQTIEEGTYTLDASKMPKTLDLKILKGLEDVGKTQPGIYQLDGTTLKVAFARPGADKRPDRFSSSGDGGALFVMTLKRLPED